MRTKVFIYKGFYIEYNFYGKGEYTFELEDSEVWCRSLEEAQIEIDVYLEEECIF